VTRQPSLRRGTWIIVNPLNQLETLSPLRSGDDHIHLPATAPGTDKPLAPLENRHIRAVSSSRQGRARRAGRASCTTRSVEREPQRRCPASSADHEQIAPSFLRIVGFFDLEPSEARRIVQALRHSPFEVVGADQLEALSSNLAVACQTVISTNNHKL